MDVYLLSYSVIMIGLIVGLFVPLVTNYFPLKSVMSKTLRDSLDVTKATKSGPPLQVKITYGFDLSQTIAAALFTAVGFISYYFAPQAFLANNTTLMFTLLNLILLLVVCGLSLLSSALFRPL